MNCPECEIEMGSEDDMYFDCNQCYRTFTLCKICKIPMKEMNSDICGHPSCIEKKAEAMFH